LLADQVDIAGEAAEGGVEAGQVGEGGVVAEVIDRDQADALLQITLHQRAYQGSADTPISIQGNA
jgi:hypothetical protein